MRYLKTPITDAQLRAILRPLCDLPVERVLVSHGAPVLSGGAHALRDLLHPGQATTAPHRQPRAGTATQAERARSYSHPDP